MQEENNNPAALTLWRPGLIVFAIALALWIWYFAWAPPLIPGGDVICFKDPGINFALGQGLVSRLDPGNPSLEAKIYANYPPLFPLLYGGFVRALGIGPKIDQIFDLLTAAAASFLFWLFITPRYSTREGLWMPFVSLAVLAATLPVGPFWTQRERPDSLAFSLILLSVMAIDALPRLSAVLSAGLLLGLAWCTSPYGFLLGCASVLIFAQQRARSVFGSLMTSRLLRIALVGLLGVAVPIAVVLVIAHFLDPGAVTRFRSHAVGSSTGGVTGVAYFVALLKGDFQHFLSALSRYDSIRYKTMVAHLITIIGLTSSVLLLYYRRLPGFLDRLSIAAIAGIGIVPLVLFPYQPCYMSFTATVVVALLVRYAARSNSLHRHFAWIAFSSILFVALPAGGFMGRELILAWKAVPSHTRIERLISSLEPAADSQPPLVASSPQAYFSFKTRRFTVVNLASVQYEADVRQIDYFALATLHDSPAPHQLYFTGWKDLDLDLIHAGRLDYQSRLLNPRFSYNWDCSIYRQRKSTSSAGAAEMLDPPEHVAMPRPRSQ